MLIEQGLTRQQASSRTTEKVVEILTRNNNEALLNEAEHYVSDMRLVVESLRGDYERLLEKIDGLSDAVQSISDAQKEYGELTDEKAKNLVTLYAALLSMNLKAGADPNESVKNAGYVLYAFLGGQARREITYTKIPDGE